jgi:hypothetical protein
MQQWYWRPLLQVWPKVTPAAVWSTVIVTMWWNTQDRQTDMDRSIKFSLLMLKCKAHLKRDLMSHVEQHTFQVLSDCGLLDCDTVQSFVWLQTI